MACSLIEHKRINTTLAKAKALKQYVEPLLTKSKADSTHSRRVVFSYLKSKEAVTELFREVAPKIADRNGGYTRIIRTGYRLGDSAEMCLLELVDFNDIYGNDDAKSSKGRTRRGGAKKKVESVVDSVTDKVEAAKDVVAEKAADIAEDVKEVVEDAAEDLTADESKDEASDENTDDKKEA